MKKRNLILIFLISLFVLPICVRAEVKPTMVCYDLEGPGNAGKTDPTTWKVSISSSDNYLEGYQYISCIVGLDKPEDEDVTSVNFVFDENFFTNDKIYIEPISQGVKDAYTISSISDTSRAVNIKVKEQSSLPSGRYLVVKIKRLKGWNYSKELSDGRAVPYTVRLGSDGESVTENIYITTSTFDIMNVTDAEDKKNKYVGQGDIIYLRKVVAGLVADYDEEKCDVDGSSEVNMKDVLALRTWILTGGSGEYDISYLDVNGDGEFTMMEDWIEKTDDELGTLVSGLTLEEARLEFDDYYLASVIAGLVTDYDEDLCDVNKDGKVDMKDLLRLRKGIIGDSLEEEETTDNPKTGVFFKYGIVALLAVLASVGLVISRKNNKFPRRG